MPYDIKEYKMYIGGQWVDAASGKTYESLCPGDNEVHAILPLGDKKDVDRAVEAARDAFDNTEWALPYNFPERAKLLRAAAAKIRDNLDYLAELESKDGGKTITESTLIDVHHTADCFDFYADLAGSFGGDVIRAPGEWFDFTLREPLGVCGAVVAWNFPIMYTGWKMAPALAMGNTCVFKPAQVTSCTALGIAKICDEVGFPPGTINVVSGPGSKVGSAIAAHMDVDKISFTGSTEVGRKILELSAGNIKKTTLELGGKSPNIVFDDADINDAVSGTMTGIFFNAGQVCIAGSRLFVQEGIYDQFLEQLISRTKNIVVGHPLDWDARMGAISSPDQMETIMKYIEIGKKEATLACGGRRIDKGELAKGNFIEPTIFTDITPDKTIFKEEIFGPVLAVIKFSSEEEVIAMANDTIYGLASGVWTNDLKRAFRVIHALKAGTVWVNNYSMLTPQTTHGGYKQSGYGKDLGKYAIEGYTQIKNVYLDTRLGELIAIFE